MSSGYPPALDSFSTSHADNVSEVVHASTVNDLADAVNKIEAALGTNPQGSATDVKTRITNAETTLPSTSQSGTTYTLALADAGTVVQFTSTTAVTVTVPADATTNFPVGSIIELFQDSTGTVTVAAAGGVTIHNAGPSLSSAGQYCTILLRKIATNEWVISGELVTRIKSDAELQLAALGLVSTNYHPTLAPNQSSPSSGNAYLMRVPLRATMQITGLMIAISTAAVGTAPTGIYAGLADTSGKVLVQSGNLNGTVWTSTGYLSMPFGSTYTVPSDGSYYAFILVNGTWSTTQPQLPRSNNTIPADTRLDARASGLSTPPANGSSFTLLADSSVFHFWVGCVGS